MKHLEDTNETYMEHAKHALWIAGQCCIIIGALIVHAIYPDWLVRTASNRIMSIERYRRARISHKLLSRLPPNCS